MYVIARSIISCHCEEEHSDDEAISYSYQIRYSLIIYMYIRKGLVIR